MQYPAWVMKILPLCALLSLGIQAHTEDATMVPRAGIAEGLNRIINGTMSWTTSSPLVLPVDNSDGSTHLAYKNPSVVQANGAWYVIASRKRYLEGKVRHSLVYFRITDWSKPESSRVVPLFTDEAYTSAPAIFYYTHQHRWYVIFDWKDPTTGYAGPAFSTFEDIDQPETLTKPQKCFPSIPTSLPKKSGVRWLDPSLISDGTRMFMFFTDESGHFLRSSTSLDAFPVGWDDPVVVMSLPTTVLFEGNCTYRLKDSGKYLTIIEAIAPETKERFYNAFTADRLDGDWHLIPGGVQRPFAGSANVTTKDGSAGWSRHISHGELLRPTNDERMILDPTHLTFLYQGWDMQSRVTGIPLGPFNGYHEIPYQLALLESTLSTHK